jgi:pimeloyl-ACP methyl ester carboxylesterase
MSTSNRSEEDRHAHDHGTSGSAPRSRPVVNGLGAHLHEDLLDGVPIRWLENGEGSPVVLVHGIPTSPRLWRHVMPLVSGRSLALEMTGYGSSIPDGEGHGLGLAAQADRLLRWLDLVDVEAPVIVGHDLGGGVAQIAAVREPGRFSGIVLTNAVCYDSWPIPSVKAMRSAASVLRYMPEVALYPSFVQLVHRGHDDRARALESIGVHWQHYVTHGAARSLMRQVGALRVEDTLAVSDQLPRLGLPARVVWGDAEQFQKVEYGRRLAADLGTTLRLIPGGKHFTPEDHPEVIAAAVNELLAPPTSEEPR